MKEEGELKVYSFTHPYTKTFTQQQFATFGHLQSAVEEWFGIPINQQKWLRDQKVVTYWKTAAISNLKLTSATRLVVLTTNGRSIKRNKIGKPEKEKVERSSVPAAIDWSISIQPKQKQEEKSQEGNVKVLNFLKDQAIKHLVTQFIKSLKIPRAELLLLDDNKLKFTLQRIAKDNPFLLNFLLNNLQTVSDALLDESRLDFIPNHTHQTVAPASIVYLQALGYSESQSKIALQLSRNSIYEALQKLCNDIEDRVRFRLRRESIVEEYRSISEWLSLEENKALVLYLKNSPQELDVFINYWKHTNSELQETILRWRSFMGDLINYHYHKLKP